MITLQDKLNAKCLQTCQVLELSVSLHITNRHLGRAFPSKKSAEYLATYNLHNQEMAALHQPFA